MKVFVIPSWHPTPTRPLWCNWVLPHIALLRENGLEAYVLQLGLDDERITGGTDPWSQPVRHLGQYHLYTAVPWPTKRHQRTRFFYGRFLKRYVARLREVYHTAVETWGKPDVLHAHVSLPGGYGASCLGREFNIPVIVHEHYTGFESDARFPWRVGCYVREMGRRIQAFYAVSPGYADRIRRMRLVNVTGVLPNPIDTELFAPSQFHQSQKPFQIVTAGNVDLRKGADLLFGALGRLRSCLDWRLTLFGEIPRREGFHRWLNDPEFSCRLTLPGRVSQAELAQFYSQSDLYVVSSRIETANVSMLQAMACGVPVVTTSCGAPETLIDDSVGIAVARNDPTALAEGILEASRNIERYDRQTLRRFVVERYSKPVVAKLVIEAYEKTLEQREGRTVGRCESVTL